MKNLKFLFTVLIMTLCVGASFGQSAKMQQRAIDKTAEFNASILSADETAALTDEQTETIQALFLKMFEGIKAVRQGEGTDEEKQEQIKATRKAVYQEIHQNVLTKQQRQAKRAANQKG